jgi:hypothetical protein
MSVASRLTINRPGKICRAGFPASATGSINDLSARVDFLRPASAADICRPHRGQRPHGRLGHRDQMVCSAHAAIDIHDITTKQTRDVDLRAAVRQVVGGRKRLTSLRRARQSVNQPDADALQRTFAEHCKKTPSTSGCTMRRAKVAPWPIAPFPGLIEQAMIELRNREHSRL